MIEPLAMAMRSEIRIISGVLPVRKLAAVVVLLMATLPGAMAQLLPEAESQAESGREITEEDIAVSQGSRPGDGDIRARLSGILENLPALREVTITVKNGIVFLDGTVDEIESGELAQQLAERVEGTVMVVNRISRDSDIAVRIAAATEKLGDRFEQLAGMIPVLLLAGAVIGIAIFAARVAGRAKWLYGRLSHNWFIRDLLRQVLQVAIVFVGILIALQLLDASALLGSLVGALGIIGLAIGFAMRDTVENYIASILLSVRQPFRREDHIRVDAIEGKVLRLTPRATVLMSLDGNHIRIPNATVFKSTIVNYTLNPLRRFSFEVGVATDIDLQRTRRLAVEALAGTPGVLEAPPPACHIKALGDSSVVLTLLGWLDQREADYYKLSSAAQRALKEAFDAAGVVMPEPIYNVNLRRSPHEPAAPGTRVAAEPRDAVTESRSDTEPDRAVDEQIRAEQRDTGDTDLLNASAPQE